jgi:AraC-like DNA-binding protein
MQRELTPRRHAAIIYKFLKEIEDDLDHTLLYISELCTAIGVSERTLRECCQRHLGMSPKQYLLLRRMNLVRRALCESVPAASTVTEVATRYGFWQFGRFAGVYKSLFGELPSTTLGRPAHECDYAFLDVVFSTSARPAVKAA